MSKTIEVSVNNVNLDLHTKDLTTDIDVAFTESKPDLALGLSQLLEDVQDVLDTDTLTLIIINSLANTGKMSNFMASFIQLLDGFESTQKKGE